MLKKLQTTTEPNGDVHTDFSGFVGEECVSEEERLRQQLAKHETGAIP